MIKIDDKIIRNNPILTLSEEKVLNLLLDKVNQLVKRDDVAKALWSNLWLEKYSDYMIDKVIYQIRKKLVSPYKITTFRNRGIIFSKSETMPFKIIRNIPTVKSDGTYPHEEYLKYMNDTTNIRKTLADLFKSIEKEKINKYLEKSLNDIKEPMILVVNSYSHDNVDAISSWLLNHHFYARVIFSHFDDRAIKIHQKRIFDLGLENIEAIYDDIRKTRLTINSFDLVINDFRLNFNSNHEQNQQTIYGIKKILKSDGMVIISVVVDSRYESSRYGVDQEKAPINKRSPHKFMFKENLERYCFTVPYYKKLFTKSGFEIVKEFDVAEGKTWFSKEKFTPNHEPTYRRFLLKKT